MPHILEFNAMNIIQNIVSLYSSGSNNRGPFCNPLKDRPQIETALTNLQQNLKSSLNSHKYFIDMTQTKGSKKHF